MFVLRALTGGEWPHDTWSSHVHHLSSRAKSNYTWILKTPVHIMSAHTLSVKKFTWPKANQWGREVNLANGGKKFCS